MKSKPSVYSYDTWFYVRNKQGKRYKRPIAGLHHADNIILESVVDEHPDYTINQLREYFCDKSKCVYQPDIVNVLDIHIEKGYGDEVPRMWGSKKRKGGKK